MISENFSIVIDESGLPPRAFEGLVNSIRDCLHCNPIVTAVPSEVGFYTKIVMPGEHDFKDLISVTTEIRFWIVAENVVDFSFCGKKL